MSTILFDEDHLKAMNRRLTRIVMGAGGIIVLLIVALILRMPKGSPYVLTPDHGGHIILAVAQPYLGPQSLGDDFLERQLEDFIYNSRVITTNYPLEMHNMDMAYGLVAGQARKKLDAFYQPNSDHDPRVLSSKGAWRSAHITRFLRAAEPSTYQIDWSETLYPANNQPAVTTYWQAILTTADEAPDPDNEFNPTGRYVIALDWAPQDQPPTTTE